MNEICLATAHRIADQIRRKEWSCTEVAQAHLVRIEKLNPSLNAFVHFQPEKILDQAKRAEKEVQRGAQLGLLHGVPLSIKSSIDVTGHRCEAGSRLRKGQVADTDAPLVSRLRKAGAVILGVTNAPELLMAWETDNLLYGRTNNPWDLSRTAGGSSGGEASAIAAGLSAGGVGSDGGGSIREPAHFCGICGLKPTPGVVPSTGHYPKAGGPFALIGVVGPMARTVQDLSLLFSTIAGYDDGDPCATPAVVGGQFISFEDVSKSERPKIAMFEDDGRTPVTGDTRAAVRHAASLLTNCGFSVDEFRPQGLDEARTIWADFFVTAGGMILEPMLDGREQELSPIMLEFRDWAEARPALTADSLLSSWLGRDAVREKILIQMREYPILLCPTAAIPAFRHGERQWKIDDKSVEYLDAWSYCEWFNLLGFPAAVVPLGRSREGLPIAVQIVGRPFQDDVVLSVAAKLEAARGPWQPPPIAA